MKFVTPKIFGGEIVLSKLLFASKRKKRIYKYDLKCEIYSQQKNYLSDEEISLYDIPLQKKKFIGNKIEVFIVLEI